LDDPDLRRMLDSEEGISLREVAGALDRHLEQLAPDAYIDLGRMLRQPADIVIDLRGAAETPAFTDKLFRGLLGNGYARTMRASPLVARLRHMQAEIDHGDDT